VPLISQGETAEILIFFVLLFRLSLVEHTLPSYTVSQPDCCYHFLHPYNCFHFKYFSGSTAVKSLSPRRICRIKRSNFEWRMTFANLSSLSVQLRCAKADLYAAICRPDLSASINRSESVYVQYKHCTCIF